MKYIIGSVFTVLFFIGCTSSGPNARSGEVYMYNDINFGYDRDEHFKKGVQDACRTAEGYYMKNHELFHNNISYKIGWEDGRLQCKGK